ncbi:PREDICTED: uncharacterized protein LOC109207009 [Nicotiana attenuata]|uniref:uncharacterized protein LOC109207009 n=1 Tax=Nicotiana attenuata TaxID=49451 RepID=UPI000905AF57|nr:PREDICTED: uncharacterized protein LOC109207009 [Nicotiana attenuata]
MENKVVDSANREATLKEQQLLNQKATKEAEQEKSKVVVGENQQKWSNLFTGNKMAARGTIIARGDGIGKYKWQKAIIVYIIGESPSVGAMERFIVVQWNFAAKPKVYYHNEGYFVILFNSMDDKNVVLYSGPYTMGVKPLILKSWTEDFDLYNEVLKTIPLWVSFPNLPLNCWGRLTLSRIASGLGTPLYADECTSNASRISYARVLIEMDISKELPKCIKIQDPSGKEFEQMVEYDWVPQYCRKCLMVGHDCERDQGRAETTKRSVQNEQHQNKQQGRSTNIIGNIQQTRKPTTQ